MYLKEKLVKVLKIKNAVLAMYTILSLIVSVSWELYLVVRYWGDWFTIAHARATPDFIFWVIAGPVILLIIYISKEWIGDAYFYNSYFEGDLDGSVTDAEHHYQCVFVFRPDAAAGKPDTEDKACYDRRP